MSIVWEICVKYITPAMLGIIIIQALIGDLTKPYEGYAKKALLMYGAGMLLITIAIAVYLSLHSWDKAKHYHKPEEDHLLT